MLVSLGRVFDSPAYSDNGNSRSILAANTFDGPSTDHVQDLVDKSGDCYKKLTGHVFPQKLAKGTASFNGFRYYMIVSRRFFFCSESVHLPLIHQQDLYYLDVFYAVELLAIVGSELSWVNVSKEINDVGYIAGFNNNNLAQLGVEQTIIDKTQPSQALKDSKNHYLKDVVIDVPGDWLAFVAL